MNAFPHLPPPPVTHPRSPRSRAKWLLIAALAAAVAVLIIVSVGRSMYHYRGISSAAVESFHHQLDQGDYDTIWENSTDAFRAVGTHAEAIKVFEIVHQKMGASGKTNAIGFHVNWQANRVYVNHVFDTEFANGHAQESFIWVVEQDEARLQGYHCESPLLQ